MERTTVATTDAPAAIGPYAQAITLGDLVFTSGQLGFDPATGEFVSPDIAAQARQALTNLAAVLAAAGSSMEQVVKTTVFLADMNEFAAMNTVYGEFFPSTPPARSTVQVARLPRDARVEIEVIASRSA